MLAPFSNYPVNQAYERLMAELRAERAARAARNEAGVIARILNALFGARKTATAA